MNRILPLSLLTTKLFGPPPRPNLIERPQLIERLNEGLRYPLTLVAAGAGFGKTTLIVNWKLTMNNCQFAWLSLDEGDSDPRRFWAYVIAALQTLDAHLGERALAMLQAQGQPLPRAEFFLTLLLNDAAAFPEQFALVLDDYHVISTPDVHEGIAFLVEHLPPQMHLVMASRSDPPLPLARWRARGQLTEIRADELRLTVEEAATFLTRLKGLPLSPDDVRALHARTEGWLVGLQLAALAMQGRADAAEFIAAFTGSHHYILDYLTQEALQRQPESVQSFLLHTAILERVSGALCDAVTGRADSQAVLQDLERANVFITSLDDERHWYRYYHLFAEMLRQRLRQLYPARLPDLHRRASEWYAQNGFADEAVHHALAGQDFERAAQLMEHSASAIFWMRGEISTFLGWLDALPDDLVHAHPRLGLVYAWALLMSGKLATVEPRLEAVERSLLNPSDSSGLDELEIKRLRGQIAAIRSRVARLRNDLPRAIELSQRALDDLPPDTGALRSVITLNLGIAYWQSGDLEAAARVLAQASALSESGGSALVALGILGDLQAEQGHLHRAAGIYQQAIDRAAANGKLRSPMVAWAWIGLGDLHREWNDLDTAERHTRQGAELAKQWGNTDGLAWAWLHLGQLKAAQGDATGAQAALDEAEQIVRRYEVAPWTAAKVAGYQGTLWIRQGNLAEAARWARERGLSDVGIEGEFSYLRGPEYLTLARLLIAERKWEQAESYLTWLLRSAEASGLTGRVIEILVLQAVAYRHREKTTPALAALERALSLAEPEGYLRVFVDEGEPMRLLIARMLASDDHRMQIERQAHSRNEENTRQLRLYADKLLPAFTRQSAWPNAQSEITKLPSAILVEPLSARELEILPLLAQGLSNREIADSLVVSVGTVKVHLKHIYGKLGISSRTQAIACARELNLL